MRYRIVERITTRIALQSARPRDLSALRDGLQHLPNLRNYVSMCIADNQTSVLTKILSDLATPVDCLDLLERGLMPLPSTMVRMAVSSRMALTPN
jgi:DNA mismatch repair protein MutS